MTQAEMLMLMAHGVPEAALVDAIVWGKMQRMMGEAYHMVDQARQMEYLPPTGFANTVQDAMTATRYAGVQIARPQKAQKAV